MKFAGKRVELENILDEISQTKNNMQRMYIIDKWLLPQKYKILMIELTDSKLNKKE